MKCALTGTIAGLDEAGRGPLAGPVVSACVAWEGLPQSREKVNDSKLLTEDERKAFFSWIIENARNVSVGLANHLEIEQFNIHHATLLSMERAVADLNIPLNLLLVDGLFPLKGFPQSRPIVKGDRKCFFIACASIVAKVVRDRLMEVYDSIYPGYNFKKHKGYATDEHRAAIEVRGPSPIHRRTFRGVREYIVE